MKRFIKGQVPKISGQTFLQRATPLYMILLLLAIGHTAIAKAPCQDKSQVETGIKPPKRKAKHKKIQKARKAHRIRERLKRQQRRRVKRAIRKYSRKTKPRHRKIRNRNAVNRTAAKKRIRKQTGKPFFVFRFAKWSAQKTGQLLHATAAFMIVPIALLSKLD